MKKILILVVFILYSMNVTAQQQSTHTFWEGLYLNTVERNILTLGKEIVVKGYITGTDRDSVPLNVRYTINLTPEWEFLGASIVKNDVGTLSIHKVDGHWTVNGKERYDLEGCDFIDINISPFTNSLPINRLDFASSDGQKIKVAFIDVLKNEVVLSNQRYTKLDDRHYKYKNLDSGFERTIEVDLLGLVVEYPGIWKRLKAPSKFESTLVASHPSGTISNEMDIYGWLVGDWDAKVIDYGADGTQRVQTGEWHFSWVLEGRAMQDVWIVPKRGSRNTVEEGNRYGTSLRVFNPEKQLWELTWSNPVTGAFDRLEGKEIEGELVHEGIDEEGNLQRWAFTDIEQDSFRWTGERSTDGGKTWNLEAEFFLTRN